MELEDLEQVLRHVIQAAGFRADPDGDVGVEPAARVDLSQRRLGMDIVARIPDRPDASRKHRLGQPGDTGPIVRRLDDDRGRLVHGARRNDDTGLTVRRHDGGGLVRLRRALAAVRIRALALRPDADEELDGECAIVEQRDIPVRVHVLQLATIVHAVHVDHTELPRARLYGDTVRAAGVEIVIGGMPVRVIRGVGDLQIGARKRAYDLAAAEVADRDGGTELLGEYLLCG